MIIDLLILVVVLTISGIALYRKRSRGIIWILSLFSLAYFGFFRKGCLCAVGSIQNITDAFLMGQIPVGTIAILFLIPLVVALIWGRLFCGTACPLGAIQDLLSIDKIKIPLILDQIFILLPPLVLFLVIVSVVRGDGYLLCRFDPFVPIFRLHAPEIPLIISFIVLCVSILISRPFCRWFCPYGVLLGIAALFSKWRVNIEPTSNCKTCHLCPPACPVNCIRMEAGSGVSRSRKAIPFLFVPLLLIMGVAIGGQLAILPKWFFEKETLSLTAELLAKLQLTGSIMGCITGIAWSVELIVAFSPQPTGYKPIKHRCISCARCYNHCPGEVKIVRAKLKGEI